MCPGATHFSIKSASGRRWRRRAASPGQLAGGEPARADRSIVSVARSNVWLNKVGRANRTIRSKTHWLFKRSGRITDNKIETGPQRSLFYRRLNPPRPRGVLTAGVAWQVNGLVARIRVSDEDKARPLASAPGTKAPALGNIGGRGRVLMGGHGAHPGGGRALR